MQRRNPNEQAIASYVPRELWRQLKYEAWRRQTTAKKMLIEAIERAVERWRQENVQL